MSRSGYSDDCESNMISLYRANVVRAFAGKRGQRFLKEMLFALDALPERKLTHSLMEEGNLVCAIGSVGRARGIDMTRLDPEKYDEYEFGDLVALAFRIATPMAREIMYQNDGEAFYWRVGKDKETPEERWVRMRAWVASMIKTEGKL